MPWNTHPSRSSACPLSLKANPSRLRSTFMLHGPLLLCCSHCRSDCLPTTRGRSICCLQPVTSRSRGCTDTCTRCGPPALPELDDPLDPNPAGSPQQQRAKGLHSLEIITFLFATTRLCWPPDSPAPLTSSQYGSAGKAGQAAIFWVSIRHLWDFLV